VSVLRVWGYALPEGEPVDLYADGDRWATEAVAAADLVAEGWLLPGLVDAHTHPGAGGPGQPLDDGLLREDLREHVASPIPPGKPILQGTAWTPVWKGVQR
jgi:hypothetical protein